KLTSFEQALRWLRTIAIRECIDAHRRAQRRKIRETRRAVRPEAESSPQARFESQEMLAMGLSKLSHHQREVVALVFFEGRTRQDAAKALNIDRGTLSRRIRESLDRLRALMSSSAAIALTSGVALESELTAGPLPLSRTFFAGLA